MSSTHIYGDRSVEFIKSFIQEESDKSLRPRVLTAGEREENCKVLAQVNHLQPHYAALTGENVGHILRKWKQ
jgi:hypothetical protein